MSNHQISVVENGTKTLLTEGKYCDRNIDVVVNVPSDKTDLTPIVEALTEKGVTVPDGTTVDGLADLIAAIEAGGGSGGAKVSFGTITLSESTGSLSWEHGLGEAPGYAIIFLSPGYTVGTTYATSLRSFIRKENFLMQDNYVTRVSANNHIHDSTGSKMSATETEVTAQAMSYNGNVYKFVAGIPYLWVCATGVLFE